MDSGTVGSKIMIHHGVVKEGRIEFPLGVTLPDGCAATVIIEDEQYDAGKPAVPKAIERSGKLSRAEWEAMAIELGEGLNDPTFVRPEQLPMDDIEAILP
jgi:hypothetical protein